MEGFPSELKSKIYKIWCQYGHPIWIFNVDQEIKTKTNSQDMKEEVMGKILCGPKHVDKGKPGHGDVNLILHLKWRI